MRYYISDILEDATDQWSINYDSNTVKVLFTGFESYTEYGISYHGGNEVVVGDVIIICYLKHPFFYIK